MVAYRFCRPDDSPYIVQAVNECVQVHFPDRPPLTLEDFQAAVRELDVWPSNCMVASEASRPIAVCIATKRPDEVLIYRVGARPGFERRGHGVHMLTSLSQKLAVLGPSRLVAELPGDRPDLQAFFEAAGYRREAEFVDYVVAGPPAPPEDWSALTPVTVSDVAGLGLLGEGSEPCWERQLPTLRARADAVSGWGLVAGDSLAGFVLCRDVGSERQVLAWGAESGAAGPVLELLLARAAADGRPLRLLKTTSGEIDERLRERLGLQPDAVILRYSTTAQPL